MTLFMTQTMINNLKMLCTIRFSGVMLSLFQWGCMLTIKWIQKEIDGAAEYNKPILAVNPWAQKRSSSVVGDASDKKVGWNSKSVVGGI